MPRTLKKPISPNNPEFHAILEKSQKAIRAKILAQYAKKDEKEGEKK